MQKVLQKDREGNDKDGLKLFLDRIPRQIYGLDLGPEKVRIFCFAFMNYVISKLVILQNSVVLQVAKVFELFVHGEVPFPSKYTGPFKTPFEELAQKLKMREMMMMKLINAGRIILSDPSLIA